MRQLIGLMLLSCVLSFCAAPAAETGGGASKPKANTVEMGRVNWTRDVDAALVAAEKSGKPVLVLFQEVPG